MTSFSTTLLNQSEDCQGGEWEAVVANTSTPPPVCACYQGIKSAWRLCNLWPLWGCGCSLPSCLVTKLTNLHIVDVPLAGQFLPLTNQIKPVVTQPRALPQYPTEAGSLQDFQPESQVWTFLEQEKPGKLYHESLQPLQRGQRRRDHHSVVHCLEIKQGRMSYSCERLAIGFSRF